MKSKIMIDLDWDNQPVIKIQYEPSDDVRDKMVKRFLDTFGTESIWAQFSYEHTFPELPVNSRATIRPIPSNIGNLEEQATILKDTITKTKNFQETVYNKASPETENNG